MQALGTGIKMIPGSGTTLARRYVFGYKIEREPTIFGEYLSVPFRPRFYQKQKLLNQQRSKLTKGH